jgi:hypothetical protein
METTNANLNVNVSNIKVGDKIFLRSNCHYNTNVETVETAYLIPGRYSCDDGEEETVLVCIIAPFEKKVNTEVFDDSLGYSVKKTKIANMIRVMSTVTKKCYDVDADWCDVIETDKGYKARRELTLLMDEVHNMLDDEFDEFEDYE